MKIFSKLYTSPKRAAIKLAERLEIPASRPGQPVLLCMNRAVLSTDIAAMQDRTNLSFVSVSAAEFEALLARSVSSDLQVQTFFTRSYASLPEATRATLRDICAAFLRTVLSRVPIDAVIAGNSDYWQDDVVKDVCKDLGLKFIVLCRENYVVRYEQDLLRKRIAESGFVFHGDAVAVASEVTRETMLSTPAYLPHMVHTVGWPRFDGWIDQPVTTDDTNRTILLVAYQQKTYLAPENFADVLRAFVGAAKQSGQPKRFCIKIKKSSHIKDLMLACPSLLFSGIRIVANTPLDRLIRQANMVIGYNTTGMLEAYLSKAAVVVPWWKDAVRGGDCNLICEDNPLDRDTTYFPTHPEELRDIIAQALNGELPQKGTAEMRLKQFQRYICHEPGETASKRFERLVRQCLNRETE